MTERRPHWDDHLLASVMVHCNDIYQCHAVIAAVEDWHKAKRDSRIRTHSEGCWRWHTECAESLIEWQQHAIQRVRELCEGKTQEVAASDPLFGPPCALYVDDILRALEGDSDE